MKKRVIYTPAGRAREYSSLALNIINGCHMGCDYCYVPRITKKKKDFFHNNSVHRKDLLKKLEKDLQELKEEGNTSLIMLSFTSDVYQLGEKFNSITRDVLKLFRKYDQPFHILTKGGTKAVRDFDLYKDTDWFACSLTFYNKEKSLQIEPNASLPEDRIEALKIANSKGIKTWVSFEPTLEAEETYKLYDVTKDFVNFYKVGKITGYPSDVDWDIFANKIADMMENDKKPFFIKFDLRKHLKKDVSEYKYHREVK